ncbi:MAG: thioredoxin family protein [Gammaproteobacteria bacterium]|nr:thioredoxin family protein [Gammaproteobacteria bacterium]
MNRGLACKKAECMEVRAMEVRLLVSQWCPVCPQAEAVWAEVARRHSLDYRVLDIAKPEGRTLVADLRIRTVPAVVVDGQLKAVGVQSVNDALALVGLAA